MPEDRIVISSEAQLTAEEIARRSFATSFRGFDAPEVRSFLRRVSEAFADLQARERELRRRLEEAQRAPAAAPQLDEEALTAALGEETARVLRSAREAAQEIQAKAEQKVARLTRESQEEAARLRAEAESVLARRIEEAEEVAAGIRRAAEADAEAIRARAAADAEAELEAARARGREMVTEAQALRERVLGDLARRRKLAHAQVEQLRAGRERLLEAYRMVRRTLDEVTEELTAAEAEARLAAEAAGRRVNAEAEVGIEALEAELAAARAADLVARAEPDAAPDASPAEPAPTTADAEQPPAAPREAAVEPAAEPGARDEPVETPPATAAEVVPLGERRSSTLRILRPNRAGNGSVPIELAVVEPAAADEGVRVLRGREVVPDAAVEPEAPPHLEPQAPAPADDVAAAVPALAAAAADAAVESAGTSPEATDAPADVPTDAGGGGPDIDGLFARIRADRARAVANAQAVLEAERDAAGDAAADGGEAPHVADDDERHLQRRDALLEKIDTGLVRKLKRALQDDQNETLDRLRTTKGRVELSAVLPDEAAHATRFRDAAEPFLREAAAAGAVFAGGAGGSSGSAADDLALDLTLALRERLARAFDEAHASGDDAASVVERVNSTYREWKLHRIEPAARDAVARAFAQGAYGATPDGTLLRWVVDDDGGPCPDCDDDALAGPTPKGQEFPTGQHHPPAHAGCRCLLVPVPS